MLRVLVAALLLANLLYFGWSRGWLDAVVGIPAQGDREPQRLANQFRPERVTLLPIGARSSDAVAITPVTADSAASAASASDTAAAAVASASGVVGVAARASPVGPTPASATAALSPPAASAPARAVAAASAAGPPQSTAASRPATVVAATIAPTGSASSPPAAAPLACLETGPFVDAELPAAEAVLTSALPSGSWTVRKSAGGEWMIYMGPYPDPDWLERKKNELARIRGGVPQEVVSLATESARGISLGRFENQAAANATLGQYRSRGIRTARVVRAGPGRVQNWVRVAQADPALAGRLRAMKLPGASVKSFAACAGR